MIRLLPCGDRAILVDLDDDRERRDFDAALRAEIAAGRLADEIIEHVPAARTVLVRLRDPRHRGSVETALHSLEVGAACVEDQSSGEVTVPVHYDGADLQALAHQLGVRPTELVEWHTATPWLVDFTGFAPGFGYLVREPVGSPLDDVEIPRLDSPRTRIPSGAVALAGRWSAVYPSASPGGWQLIGGTDLPIWDVDRDPPGLFQAGVRVRFEVMP